MPYVKTLPGGKTIQTNKKREFRMGGGAICGAKKKKRPGQKQGKCLLAAGWGTNHPGFGPCKFHGGSMPSHIKAAAKKRLGVLLGAELEIDPLNALMWTIRLAAGEMVFWKNQMELMQDTELMKDTIAGKQVNEAIREYRRARDDLARYSADAIKLGLQERQVRMAEMYGQMLYTLLSGVTSRLHPHLTDEGRRLIPWAVKEAMQEMEQQQLALPAGDS